MVAVLSQAQATCVDEHLKKIWPRVYLSLFINSAQSQELF